MNTTLVNKLKKFGFIASLAVGVMAGGARPAAATTVNCTPTLINYSDAPGFQMVTVTCGGVNYGAQLSPGNGCAPANSRTPDAQKFFMTLAESALLSGKNLNISFNVCSNGNFIYSVELVK